MAVLERLYQPRNRPAMCKWLSTIRLRSQGKKVEMLVFAYLGSRVQIKALASSYLETLICYHAVTFVVKGERGQRSLQELQVTGKWLSPMARPGPASKGTGEVHSVHRQVLRPEPCSALVYGSAGIEPETLQPQAGKSCAKQLCCLPCPTDWLLIPSQSRLIGTTSDSQKGLRVRHTDNTPLTGSVAPTFPPSWPL